MYINSANPSYALQRSTFMDATFACAAEIFAGFEKAIELNVQAVKTSLSEQSALTDAALSTQLPGKIIELQFRQFPASVQKTVAYFRHADEIATQMSSGLFAAMHEHFESSMRTFAEVFDAGSPCVATQGHIGPSGLLVAVQPAAVVSTAAQVSLLDSSGNAVSSGDSHGDRP